MLPNERKVSALVQCGLPETMEIREKFLTENGPIYQIAKSAMDASYTDEIVCDGENVLVVIEGLSMYLSEEDVCKCFPLLKKTFRRLPLWLKQCLRLSCVI